MVAILQPFIPHYRNDFFKDLLKEANGDVFVYEKEQKIHQSNFSLGSLKTHYLLSIAKKGIVIYSIKPFLKHEYDTLILMLHFAHISTWILLLLKPFHRKKIILWGQGISVKRYLKEEKKPNLLLKWMLKLADGAWFYTYTEKAQWEKHLPCLKSVALNNTISGISTILNYNDQNKSDLKLKYKIIQPRIFIFCARFNSKLRRADLLEEIIRALDPNQNGFIIIGDGPYKPLLFDLTNVYSFGSVYDQKLKNDLFNIADVYLQPAWLGLSVVEAMAYGKPIFTFMRGQDILQGVEYGYIENKKNGLIFENFNSCITTLNSIKDSEIQDMGKNSRKYVINNLTMNNMVNNAISLIDTINKNKFSI